MISTVRVLKGLVVLGALVVVEELPQSPTAKGRKRPSALRLSCHQGPWSEIYPRPLPSAVAQEYTPDHAEHRQTRSWRILLG